MEELHGLAVQREDQTPLHGHGRDKCQSANDCRPQYRIGSLKGAKGLRLCNDARPTVDNSSRGGPNWLKTGFEGSGTYTLFLHEELDRPGIQSQADSPAAE